MNLTQLNQRLDEIQSEITRTRNGRMVQLHNEVVDIRMRVAAFIGAPAKPATPEERPATEIIPLAELEKAAILNAVARCRDHRQAAIALGIGKTTLYRKLTEYAEKVSA